LLYIRCLPQLVDEASKISLELIVTGHVEPETGAHAQARRAVFAGDNQQATLALVSQS
jgi:hypothetical protein